LDCASWVTLMATSESMISFSLTATLSSSPLVLGCQRVGDERRGNHRLGHGEERALVGQRVAGLGGLQLGHSDDVAREGLGHLIARLALQNVELAHAFFGIVVD